MNNLFFESANETNNIVSSSMPVPYGYRYSPNISPCSPYFDNRWLYPYSDRMPRIPNIRTFTAQGDCTQTWILLAVVAAFLLAAYRFL